MNSDVWINGVQISDATDSENHAVGGMMQRVFDDVVEQTGGDGDGVQLHICQEIGDRKRMDEVRLARMADLSPVLEGRKDIGPPEQLDVGVRAVGPDLFQQILEANHRVRCLNQV